MTTNGEAGLIRKGSEALARRMAPLEDYVTPAADILETSDAFVLKIDLPGVEKESVSVLVEPGELQVKGHIAELFKQTKTLVYSEIRKASFYRKFNIGNGISTDEITGDFENGVLTLTLPKNDEFRIREIPIK